MQKLYSNILELIGNTPLVKINSFDYDNLYGKLEYFNPAGSIKDRVALNMIKHAQERGEIDNNTIIIEPTSGNTGIGLAFCASSLGLKFVAVMPENMSQERIKLMRAYGADVILTSKEKGIKGSVDMAEELAKKYQNEGKKIFIPMQFENTDNPEIHELTTAKEIFDDTDGKMDIVVASIGTGGTISGIAKKIKELKPSVKIIGVEAYESPLLTKGIAGVHKIQGISANFIPKTLNRELVDKIIDVKGDDAIQTARQIAKEEGILIGISSGATLFAAKEIIKEYKENNPFIVAILPDGGEKYLSGDLYE